MEVTRVRSSLVFQCFCGLYICIVVFALSLQHVSFLTECLVYTWGEGKKGQLGHEGLEAWRGRPTVVEALKGKAITRVCAGDGFSIFASDNGIVMTCGDGTSGCLGHGNWNSSTKPKLIGKMRIEYG